MSITARYENWKYDMQILLKLIFTYNIYFGCVIYEVLNFPKFCTVRAITINIPNCEHNTVVSITNSNNESKSNERCYSDIYLRSYHHSIQRFTTNKSKVENKTLTSLQPYWKSAIGRNFHLYLQTDINMIYRRKLLSYERNFFKTRPTRNNKFYNEIHCKVTLAKTSDLTERKRNIAEKESNEDIDSAAWDNWSLWSACSVTCGQGRQVRWRHCLSADCIEGLKKAQLRNCRLKDCAKGLLGWLGIKP